MSPLKPVTVRTHRITFVIVMVLAVAALPTSAYLIGTRVSDQCQSIHRVVEAGVRILDSPANMKRAYESGALSREEYLAGLAQIKRFDPLRRQNIADWRKADCKQ